MHQQRNQESRYKKPTNCTICNKNQHRKQEQPVYYAHSCLQEPAVQNLQKSVFFLNPLTKCGGWLRRRTRFLCRINLPALSTSRHTMYLFYTRFFCAFLNVSCRFTPLSKFTALISATLSLPALFQAIYVFFL